MPAPAVQDGGHWPVMNWAGTCPVETNVEAALAGNPSGPGVIWFRTQVAGLAPWRMQAKVSQGMIAGRCGGVMNRKDSLYESTKRPKPARRTVLLLGDQARPTR